MLNLLNEDIVTTFTGLGTRNTYTSIVMVFVFVFRVAGVVGRALDFNPGDPD